MSSKIIGDLCKWKEINLIEGEARRQGDESLLSITNEWLKARVFGEVPTEQSEGSTIQTINNRSWRSIYG